MRVRTPASGRAGGEGTRERVARAVVGLFAVTLVLAVLLYVFGGRYNSLLLRLVFGTINIPATTSLVSIVVLAVMVSGLIRRKRAALHLVGLFQLLGITWSSLRLWRASTGDHSHGLPVHRGHPAGFDWPSLGVDRVIVLDSAAVVFGVLALGLVVWLRPAFRARIRPGSWLRTFAVLLAGTALSLVVTYVLLGGSRAVETHSVTRTLVAVLRNSLGTPRRVDVQVLSEVSPFVPLTLEVLLSVTIVLAAWMFLRSTDAVAGWTGDREVAVRGLVAAHGERDSLAYFATRRDRSYAFADDERAVVAYRVFGSVALASGDPVGDRGAWQSAVTNWLATCREFGWIPAVTSAGADGARYFAELGFGVFPLGDEAVLDPERFTLDSTSMTGVRQAVQRARRAGLTVRVRRHAELTAAEMAEVGRWADAWRLGGPERGFSMALERLGDPADGRCLLVSAHDAAGAPVGLLSLVPWGRGGASLDLMRRSPDAPNGVVELMVAELMGHLADVTGARVSLNFAVARSVFADGEELGAGPLRRTGAGLLGLLDRFTQIESLYRNNEKYRPTWVPRYVCVESTASLPAACIAIGVAEGFLPRLAVPGAGAHATLTAEQLARAAEAERPRIAAAGAAVRRSDQSRHRVEHLEALRAAGHNPYAVGRDGGVALATFLAPGPADRSGWDEAAASGARVRINARVRRVRRHGGVAFLDLVDGRAVAQAVCEAGALGRESLHLLARCTDAGDVVILTGTVGASRQGAPSLLVEEWDIGAKALQPIPYGGLADVGRRARERTLDLLVHPEAGERLRARSLAIAAVRDTMRAEGYLEVETPMLQTTHGGATARPFRTYANAYGVDLVLRIAPELALKRLLAGDMGPVFEIGRNFRNEGADLTHNPEFTVLEAYRPFSDYHGMRLLTQRIVQAAARAVHGAEVLPLPVGPVDAAGHRTVVMADISGDWPVVRVADAVSQAVGEPVDHTTDMETLLRLAREHEVPVADDMGPGAVLEELYGELVEHATVRPTFYADFPLETSPLTGPHRSVPGLVERWDLVIRGAELGTAYSELNDPIEQRRRLTEQSFKAAAGNSEAMEIDEDFLAALEAGMPPAGGLGIGLDRLVMMLTESNIREVLTFPFVRPVPRER